MSQILCVSCRSGSPANPTGPTPCRTCGVMLPPPGARAWWVSRGEGTFGPYAFAELMTYLGDGRVQRSDFLWHDGAMVRVPIEQLPLGGAPVASPAAAAAPAAVPAHAPAAQAGAPSLAIGPDEIVLDRWSVNCAPPLGRQVTGKLTVTNRRVLFDPQTNVGGVVSVLFSFIGRAEWKRRNTFVIDKSQILQVSVESGILGARAVLRLADGSTISFDRGVVMGVDPIVAAIQQR